LLHGHFHAGQFKILLATLGLGGFEQCIKTTDLQAAGARIKASWPNSTPLRKSTMGWKTGSSARSAIKRITRIRGGWPCRRTRLRTVVQRFLSVKFSFIVFFLSPRIRHSAPAAMHPGRCESGADDGISSCLRSIGAKHSTMCSAQGK